jgi:hypothetical protein
VHPEQVLSRSPKVSVVPTDRVEDWIEINNLVNRYPHALDSRDADLFRTLWHPDATWDFGEDFGTYRGVDAMLEFLSRSWQVQDGHHLVTNVVIDVESPDRAHGCSTAYAQVSRADGVTFFPMIASYRDEYSKHEGRWVFKERRVNTDYRGVPDSKLGKHPLRNAVQEVRTS